MNNILDLRKMPDEYWRKNLTRQQHDALWRKGTEAPIFSSDTKFDSDCGWPSFDNSISKENIELQEDTSHGMIRTEVLCKKCGGHLGHLFDDGPTKTGLRYCISSLSLNFKPKK
ncbi:MAG: peptide-methionine (R)-S-oxide reductase MsrB [Patescibacteria group bacterium]